MLLKRLAQASNIPIKKWRGKCYIIAMTLLACEDGNGELVTGYYHTKKNAVADHGWVKYPDGTIADPTRWTLDNTKPAIYRGPADSCYDEEGRRWEAELDEIYKPMRDAFEESRHLNAAFMAIEALDNLKPADVFYGRSKKILTQREFVKEQTLQIRRLQNLGKTVNEILLDYEKCIS